ncbi:MAG: thioredoxin fold domain-containing protein [Inquilinus sp.]|nr:thioredoxin fold domain-containing protein [Inquilinus sp.]
MPSRADPYTAYQTDDGLYSQEWFIQSFLDLAEDLDDAAAEGKRFAIMWELRGCPYCRQTHLVNFARPEINDYVRERFNVLQLNFLGSREVTDFDGEVLPEKELARKYNIRFTPTFQFFPGSAAEIGGGTGPDVEVERMAGYFRPFHFYAMFQYVAERAYEGGSFRPFLQARFDAMTASGIDVEGW